MRAMRERQVRQLVRGGSINAKLSEGGIVDLEYAVQALQLTFGGGHDHPASPEYTSSPSGSVPFELDRSAAMRSDRTSLCIPERTDRLSSDGAR